MNITPMFFIIHFGIPMFSISLYWLIVKIIKKIKEDC